VMGMSMDDVIAKSTWNPAREIHHDELGNLSVGAPADVAVLRTHPVNLKQTPISRACADV